MKTLPTLSQRPAARDQTLATVGARGQIPAGVADYFWDEAFRRRELEHALLALFRSWGYGDVITPTFEYADTISARGGRALQTELCRFLDRDGSMLALRVDMTIAVARLVGTRLHDVTLPQRFCYAGSVFRDSELRAGQAREFLQAGVELIGSAAPAADAEILALTAAAVEQTGLTGHRLVVGQMQYFHGLLEALDLDPAAQARLQQAIDRNSEAELAAFLHDTCLPEPHQRTLRELPHLSGSNLATILAHAEELSLNDTMRAAVENLRQICRALKPYGVLDHTSLDLTEIHDLGYYTGITFELLAPGLGFRVASGGRYDDLVGTFGAPLPAVGVAFGIERLLLARSLGQRASTGAQPPPPHLLVTTGYDPQFIAMVEQARRQGLRIAVDLEQRRGDELWRAAQRMAAPSAAEWCDGLVTLATLAAPSGTGSESRSETLTLGELAARLSALALRSRSDSETAGRFASDRSGHDA